MPDIATSNSLFQSLYDMESGSISFDLNRQGTPWTEPPHTDISQLEADLVTSGSPARKRPSPPYSTYPAERHRTAYARQAHARGIGQGISGSRGCTEEICKRIAAFKVEEKILK